MDFREFTELARELRALPERFKPAIHAIVRKSAEATLEETRGGYPEKSGTMKQAMKIRETDKPGVYYVNVDSPIFYAWFWERGTKPRFTKGTRIPGQSRKSKARTGGGLPRGQILPHLEHALWTIGDRQKVAMQLELVQLVEAAGFGVEGALD